MIFHFFLLFGFFCFFFAVVFKKDRKGNKETRQQSGLTLTLSNATQREHLIKHLIVSSPSLSLEKKNTHQPRTGFLLFLCFCQSEKRRKLNWTQFDELPGTADDRSAIFSGRDCAPKAHRLIFAQGRSHPSADWTRKCLLQNRAHPAARLSQAPWRHRRSKRRRGPAGWRGEASVALASSLSLDGADGIGERS